MSGAAKATALWAVGFAHKRRRSEAVYVVEGEKDVESLRKLGLLAVSNPGGTHQGWHQSYSDELRDRNVVILPDCDNPGLNHALIIESALRGIAATVLVVLLPDLRPPQDVSDWLEGGRTLEDLVSLVRQIRSKVSLHGGRLKGGDAKQEAIFRAKLASALKLLLLALWHRTKGLTPIPTVPASKMALDTAMHRVTVQKLFTGLHQAEVLPAARDIAMGDRLGRRGSHGNERGEPSSVDVQDLKRWLNSGRPSRRRRWS